jgi:hypothetical protein
MSQHETIIATPTDGSTAALVTVASFPEPASANLAQSVLESAGIESVMQGGNANSMLPVAFMARLQVRPEDEAAAREVLTSAELTPESLASVTAAEKLTEPSS